MSDIYKQKEHELRNLLENANTFSSSFDDYVEEVDRFIDYQIKSYIKKQEEIERLHSIIKEAREYIEDKKAIIDTNQIRIFDLFEIKEQGYISKLLEILDKENK